MATFFDIWFDVPRRLHRILNRPFRVITVLHSGEGHGLHIIPTPPRCSVEFIAWKRRNYLNSAVVVEQASACKKFDDVRSRKKNPRGLCIRFKQRFQDG